MGSHISIKKTGRLLTALLVGPLAVACSGPFVLFPGGALEGATAATPADWSFTDEVDTIQLETNPGEPYSVNLWIAAADDQLYVHAGAERATWIEHMDADPRVRLQVEDAVYELAASRVETQEEFDRFADAYEVKYGLRPRNENIAEVYLYRLGAR
ncbi:MAG: hypothetical protein AAF430_17665 [Myxococcota bacterium]